MLSNWSNVTQEFVQTGIPSSNLAAAGNFTYSLKSAGRNRCVHGLYLRMVFDLTAASGTPGVVTLDDEDARQNLFTALVSQVKLTGSKPGVKGDIVQQMTLGEHYQITRQLGIIPVCPTLLESGFGAIPLDPRTGGPANSTNVELIYPILPADLGPEAGSLFALGSEQLEGMALNITFGSFSWTDSAGQVWTVAGGSATGAKIDAEIMFRFRDLDPGLVFVGNPIRYRRIQNTDSGRVNLTQDGITLGHVLRLGTAGTYTAADSAANLLRTLCYSTGSTLSNQDIYRIQQFIGGQDQPDPIYRRLSDVANEDSFRVPGLEVDQDQYGRAATLVPSVRAYQGGLRLASFRGKRPMNGIIIGAYDVAVPPQFAVSTLTRTHLFAYIAPRDTSIDGASVAGSADSLQYAPRTVEDSVRALGGVLVSA
jgi:hypothetical protein